MTGTAAELRRRSLQGFMRLDHERLRATFRTLLDAFEAGDAAGLRAAWTRFDVGLTNHMLAEERYAFPAFRREHPAEADALAQDHARFRRALLDLGVGVDLHIVNRGMAERLVAELAAHARREGKLFYAWIDEALPPADRRRLARAAGAGRVA